MNVSDMTIGFIGLGLMGNPMAQNLLATGAELTVFNRSPAKCSVLGQQGATVAQSPEDLANKVQGGIIIICVSDTPAFEAAVSGTTGITAGNLTNTLVIDMGSSEVASTKMMAQLVEQAGGRFIDAPVSGGEVGAQQGTLSIMAGGSEKDVERARAVFSTLGKALTHIGPIGTGQAAKAANQVIVGSTVSIIAEALLMAQQAGADPARVREALLGGFAGSRILELHGQRMIDGAFEPGAFARTQLKDMTQAAKLASSLELSLPYLQKNQALWSEMIDQGFGELDQSGYFKFVLSQQQVKAED